MRLTARRTWLAGGGLVLWLLPVGGVHFLGSTLPIDYSFPPRTVRIDVPAFRWTCFLSLTIVLLTGLITFVAVNWHKPRTRRTRGHGSLPHWGTLGAMLLMLSWALAWTEAAVLQPYRIYSFFPLWLGYVLLVNGLSVKRTGSCPLSRAPTRFVLLFPLSAAFWWSFEHLNRYVQNWHYLVPPDVTASEYVLLASMSFSTVLPA
ncbi:MAG: hypothetical protein KDD44_04390, partial [Bdellovibrionales bacterium]|nr:hypothetical protein [Bdellovibrionales bacterium]